MSDVFISYSRKDLLFARRLFEALSASGRDTWADWEDIPYSADWWREIQTGIDAAETFIFVISPDALASRVCQQEVAYAQSSHKRIVPILHRPVDEQVLAELWDKQAWAATARQNWAALSKLNWLFFREEDPFDNAFAE